MNGPDGCTSVEEWLARGGKVTTNRDDKVVFEVFDGVEFEWERTGLATVPTTYRCRRTGVLAHKRSRANRITPYICRGPNCTEYGKHRGYGNATFCDAHNPEAS